uniref:NAC domain-containing protein n=1 Tax=Ananas comosus var. bracteatus TaxID=296719 RepID=A0A6V7QF77_ANACO|nr:unnamed protein product [Ananas comosus var. bracteatus]
MRKTLVFYQGRAPKGKKTPWVMHEFRIEPPPPAPAPAPHPATTTTTAITPLKDDWVLCRVFSKHRGNNNINNVKPHSMGTTTTTTTTTSLYEDPLNSSLPPLMDTYAYTTTITTPTPKPRSHHNSSNSPLTGLGRCPASPASPATRTHWASAWAPTTTTTFTCPLWKGAQ